MKIQTLKDIKDVLNKIPDESLELCWFGLGECCENDISLVASEEDKIGFPEIFEKYPELNDINNLIKNIVKAQEILNIGDEKAEELSEKLFEDGLTSDYFKDEEKSSPIEELNKIKGRN